MLSRSEIEDVRGFFARAGFFEGPSTDLVFGMYLAFIWFAIKREYSPNLATVSEIVEAACGISIGPKMRQATFARMEAIGLVRATRVNNRMVPGYINIYGVKVNIDENIAKQDTEKATAEREAYFCRAKSAF